MNILNNQALTGLQIFVRDFGLAVVAFIAIVGICRSFPEFIIEGPQARAWTEFASRECPGDPIFVPVGVEPSKCAKDALEKFLINN